MSTSENAALFFGQEKGHHDAIILAVPEVSTPESNVHKGSKNEDDRSGHATIKKEKTSSKA